MDTVRYKYHATESFHVYHFDSDGPKGIIKKVVKFILVSLPGLSYYNLSFGDWNEDENDIDDFTVSNNRDAELVLATVASTIIDFTNKYPGVLMYAVGSTPSRTRRYQMGINKYWHEIEPVFEVFGLVENEGFIPFEKGRNYKAFVARRKK